MTRRNTEEDFWRKVDRDGAGCWPWLGRTTAREGYGQFDWRGTGVYAHRLAWEFTSGPIPAGMELDHLCHNRSCVNPDHLRPVTHKQNCENLTISPRNRTGYRGVYFNAARNRYVASVGHHGRVLTAGTFRTAEEAAAAAASLRAALHTPVPSPMKENPDGP